MVLDNIQKYLVNKNISLPDFHKALDKNKDGQIQLSEWVTKMTEFQIPGIQVADLTIVFEHLDVNDDGELSLNEMSLFIKGLELKKD